MLSTHFVRPRDRRCPVRVLLIAKWPLGGLAVGRRRGGNTDIAGFQSAHGKTIAPQPCHSAHDSFARFGIVHFRFHGSKMTAHAPAAFVFFGVNVAINSNHAYAGIDSSFDQLHRSRGMAIQP